MRLDTPLPPPQVRSASVTGISVFRSVPFQLSVCPLFSPIIAHRTAQLSTMIRYSTCSNSKVLNILNRPQCGHIIQGKFYANTLPSDNTEEDNSTAESIRNVARLPARFHRRMLHVLDTEAPSPERVHQPYWSTHENLKLDRKIYGLYGRKSGVNPGAMWPTKDDLEELIEKENEFEPSLQDRWKNVCMKKTEEERAMREK